MDIPTDINDVVDKVLAADAQGYTLGCLEHNRRITKCIVYGYYGASYHK